VVVLGISGSLRRESYNVKLLRAAREALPDGVDLRLFEGLKRVPPYDQDDDVEPAPEEVRRLRAEVAAADALLVATPEYNHSIPGQLKNAMDWCSRPVGKGALRGRPVAVIGASTGAFGAVWAQAEMRKVLGAAGARVIEGDVALGRAHDHFDGEGRLTDESTREQLAEVVQELLAEPRPAVLTA
jgi:chromate reductase, NAD(P)H dehydrogenase (quinone)